MQLAQISKLSLKPWQSAVLTVLSVFLTGLVLLSVLQKRPAKPIVIDNKNLTSAQVEALTTALAYIGDVQFFNADLTQIQNATLALSWVESVDIYRNWRQGISVVAVPRRAIARFGSQQMLDANGVVFRPVEKSELLNKNMVNLQGDPAEAKIMMQQLYSINTWFAPLGIHVEDLVLKSRQTWIIRFNNGLRVVVDREDTEQKLYNLPKILQKKYKNQMIQIQSIDLRYKNGFVIAWKSTNSQALTSSTPQKLR